MPQLISGRNPELFNALISAGIADEMTRRVVIDIDVQGVVIVYVEKYADSRVISVVTALGGVEIRTLVADNQSKEDDDAPSSGE